jgi:hypothetical protein
MHFLLLGHIHPRTLYLWLLDIYTVFINSIQVSCLVDDTAWFFIPAGYSGTLRNCLEKALPRTTFT